MSFYALSSPLNAEITKAWGVELVEMERLILQEMEKLIQIQEMVEKVMEEGF